MSNKGVSGGGTIRKRTVNRGGKEYSYWEGRLTVGYDAGTGRQIQRSFSGATQKAVREKMQAVAVELNNGTYKAPCKMTVGQWLDIWVADYTGDIKPSTRYLYINTIDNHIRPALAASRLETLKPHDIQRLYNTADVSPKTVKNIHGVLHKALQQAVELGYIRSNPADACKLPKASKTEIKPFDDDGIKLFLRAISGHKHELIYKIALFTGLREGEILGLSWDCLKGDRLTIKQQLQRSREKGGQYYISTPKNGKTRVITLAPSVVQMFDAQRFAQRAAQLRAGKLWSNPNNMIFTNEAGGFLSYRTVYDCFKRIVAGIGRPEARFHDLRHTYAVTALKNGDDVKTVSEALGHATAAFTLDVYAHATDSMKQASAERMERYIAGLI